MIECWRLWTGDDGDSHVEHGAIDLGDDPGALMTGAIPATSVKFQETAAGHEFSWHPAPTRQFVITLSGVLHFATRDGETFTLTPGDVLLAEDTTGSGHTWTLDDSAPWRRVYVVLADGVDVPFRRD